MEERTLMVPPHSPPPPETDMFQHSDNFFLFCNRPSFYSITVTETTSGT